MLKKIITKIKNFIGDVIWYIGAVIGCFIVGWNNPDYDEER